MELLKGEGLKKAFGGLIAVNNVDFSINEGGIMGLIGPNGAGKTTLFNLITGFHKPDSGSIKFEGKDITGMRPDRICKMGIARTFQIVKPFSNIDVTRNVMVGAFSRTGNYRVAREEAIEILKFVGLAEKKDEIPSALTIADKKRLELARALATKPRLLLLDEVAAGLNPKETLDMIELIRKIHANGVTVFMVEHVMKAIMTLCEWIIVLHHGEKIAEGAPKEIASNERVIEAYLGEKYLL
ncbi:MAG: ABC transporter ATP-binding protein [Candidatus Bathyarchaeia archaeon]